MQNRQWSRVTRGAKDRWSRVPVARLTPGPSLRGVLGTGVGGLSSTDGPARPVPGAPPLMTTDVPDCVLRGGQPWARPCWGGPARVRAGPVPWGSHGAWSLMRRPQVTGSARVWAGWAAREPRDHARTARLPSGRRRLRPMALCEQNVLGFDCTFSQSF